MEEKKDENVKETPKRKALIEFPMRFDMKLIVSAQYSIEDTRISINDIFNECMVANEFNEVKTSEKGNYRTYSYSVIVLDQQHFNEVYMMIRRVPGLKFAL